MSLYVTFFCDLCLNKEIFNQNLISYSILNYFVQK